MTLTNIPDGPRRVLLVATGAAEDRRRFPFAFAVDDPAHVRVEIDGVAPAAPAEIAVASTGAGGEVVLAEPAPAGAIVSIARGEPIARAETTAGPAGLGAGVVNAELDRILRWLADLTDRAGTDLVLPAGPDGGAVALTLPGAAARAGASIGFGPDGALALLTRADLRGFTGDAGPRGLPGAMRGAMNLAELTDPAAARLALGAPEAGALMAAIDARRGRVRALGTRLVANALRDAASAAMARDMLVDGAVDAFVEAGALDWAASSGLAHDPATASIANFTGAGPGAAFVLRSTAIDAGPDIPVVARLILLLEAVDPAPEPDDLALSVSRDGGVSWTALPVAETHGFDGPVRLLDTASGDVSAQPPGSAFVLRAASALSVRRRLHGWAVLWS